MEIRETIEGFYGKIEVCTQKLQSYQQDIDRKQENIKAVIDRISLPMEKVSGDSKLVQLCMRALNDYSKSVDLWRGAVSKYVKNKEFVNKFEKSLLLIVFADVKAGKSTLGNFVSGWHFQNTPLEKLYTRPQCYIYDHVDGSGTNGKESPLKENFFVEDEIQATASIQYFTLLNGLTWVDTPGIHSLTTEYEALAKDYVKFADLILFLTPSNSPCKQDERQEIQSLLQSNKPFLVVISKSDESRATVKDGKLGHTTVAKDSIKRLSQEEFVKKEIEEMGIGGVLEQNSYISLSTKLARRAIAENDHEAFEGSNFPKFYDQIGSIISEKNVELKMKRPKDEVNLVIDQLIGGMGENFIGLEGVITSFTASIKEITAKESTLGALCSQIVESAKSYLHTEISSFLYGEKLAGNLNSPEVLVQKIQSMVTVFVQKEVALTISQLIGNFESKAISISSFTISAKYEKAYKKIEYPVSDIKIVSRDPKGIIEHVQHLFFDKEFHEIKTSTRTKTRTIETGDNFGEFAGEVWQTLKPVVEESVKKELDRVNNEYFGGIKLTLSSLLQSAKAAKNDLISLKY